MGQSILGHRVLLAALILSAVIILILALGQFLLLAHAYVHLLVALAAHADSMAVQHTIPISFIAATTTDALLILLMRQIGVIPYLITPAANILVVMNTITAITFNVNGHVLA